MIRECGGIIVILFFFSFSPFTTEAATTGRSRKCEIIRGGLAVNVQSQQQRNTLLILSF